MANLTKDYSIWRTGLELVATNGHALLWRIGSECVRDPVTLQTASDCRATLEQTLSARTRYLNDRPKEPCTYPLPPVLETLRRYRAGLARKAEAILELHGEDCARLTARVPYKGGRAARYEDLGARHLELRGLGNFGASTAVDVALLLTAVAFTDSAMLDTNPADGLEPMFLLGNSGGAIIMPRIL